VGFQGSYAFCYVHLKSIPRVQDFFLLRLIRRLLLVFQTQIIGLANQVRIYIMNPPRLFSLKAPNSGKFLAIHDCPSTSKLGFSHPEPLPHILTNPVMRTA
jgi:hypothetical protein